MIHNMTCSRTKTFVVVASAHRNKKHVATALGGRSVSGCVTVNKVNLLNRKISGEKRTGGGEGEGEGGAASLFPKDH